jgi:hypothetical protein
MTKPGFSMNSASVSIGLLALFTVGFLVALGFAYRCGAAANDFKVVLSGAFSSFSGALLLALRSGTSESGPAQPSAPPLPALPVQAQVQDPNPVA